MLLREKGPNPFQILSTKEIYSNPWIRVVEHQVLNPLGNPGIYGVVHFKNRAVGVIPYEDGFVWMVGQHRFPLDQYSWEIPEGGCPPEEQLLETAKRELREETGLTASHYEKVVELHLSNSVSDEYGVVFLATGLSQGDSSPEETERLSVQKVPFEEVYEMVCSGEITDSLTVAGILRLKTLLLEGQGS